MHWLFLLLLVTAEVFGFRWWLHKEYYPLMFNQWAALIYSALITVDMIATWLVSLLTVHGGSLLAMWLAIFSVAVPMVVLILRFFLGWILKGELKDP